MPSVKYKIQNNLNENNIRKSDSKERPNNNNPNKSLSILSSKSLKKNEISLNNKYNTIQQDNETYNKNVNNSINIRNKTERKSNKINPAQHHKNFISKSHSADSFYIPKINSKNKAFRSKNSYSFNREMLRYPNLSNSISHYSNTFSKPLSKYENIYSIVNSTYRKKKSTFEEHNYDDPNNEKNVNMNGLFYNERFSHYRKDNKIFNKSSNEDKLDKEKNNLTRSTSYKNILNNDNSRIIKNNQSTIDINNSLLRENQEESQVITSTKNNIYLNRDFSRDNLDNKSKIFVNNENNYPKGEYNENIGARESLIGCPNLSMVKSSKKIGVNRYSDNNSKKDNKNNNRMNNYNYRYDLYNKKFVDNSNKLREKENDEKRSIQSQIYRAYLKKDFLIETLNVQLSKGENVDVIFIGDEYYYQNEFLEKKYQEKDDESRANKLSISNCYLIYDGNHHRIPREYIDIQNF